MSKPGQRAAKATPARRSRQDVRRARNRKQLIDATLELVAHEGSGALTATRIARAAGIDPSGFYAHFKSSEECERAAAAELDQYIASMVSPYLELRELTDATGAAQGFEKLMAAWLAEPRWSKLMLRARYEESPIGELTRAIFAGVRKDVGAVLWDMALSAGARGRHLDRVGMLAELCVGSYMTMLEAVVQGRVTDVGLASRTIAQANAAVVAAELARIAEETSS